MSIDHWNIDKVLPFALYSANYAHGVRCSPLRHLHPRQAILGLYGLTVQTTLPNQIEPELLQWISALTSTLSVVITLASARRGKVTAIPKEFTVAKVCMPFECDLTPGFRCEEGMGHRLWVHAKESAH